MDIETLEKANELNKRISDFNSALNCFEWQPDRGREPISLNPRLIIEYDADGREQQPLPMNLSDEIVKFLKSEIIKGRDIAMAEFNAL